MIPLSKAEEVLVFLREAKLTGAAFRKLAMSRLSELDGYNWCGIYRLEGESLELDEYVGDETEHTKIPVGVGVCGTAVAQDRNQVVKDVRDLSNYLACSVTTRSEIVVLIRKDGEVLGQIDIDGHTVGAFDETDENFLNQLAELIAERWEP